jgi:hypothetical protein
MLNLGKNWKLGALGSEDHCGAFHDSLEALRMPKDVVIDRRQILALLPVGARRHSDTCPNCLEAIDDFVAMRNLLLPLSREIASPTPGPWFSSKVMNAIAAQEAETNGSESVWFNVRSLAPRLAAFSALLLVLSGTWAFQVRRQVQSRQMVRPAESLFEATPSAPLNDDVMASVGDRQ